MKLEKQVGERGVQQTMKEQCRFLGPSELEQYNQPGRRVNRYILEFLSEQNRADSVREQELGPYFYNRLKMLASGKYRWFESCFIEIMEADGSSWSSQIVNDVVAKSFSHFYRFCLADQLNFGKLPSIAEFIGKRAFLKTAVENKLTTSFIGLRNWITPVIIIGAVLLGVATKALEIMLKFKTEILKNQPLEVLVDPWFIGITASLILFGLLLQRISIHFSTKTKSKSIEKRTNCFTRSTTKTKKSIQTR